jgi:very-short-patch-repair endonuclease
LQYWLNKGYSPKEAQKKLSERQTTFSLEKCVERHGLEEGIKVFNERQRKWQETLQGRDDYADIVHRRIHSNGYAKASNESLKLFIPLYKWLRRKHGFSRDDILFGINGSRELFLINPELEVTNGLYDFTILPLKLIIEFHGIKFHPKSENDQNFKPFHDINTKEAWQHNRDKVKLAESNGFTVFEVWSDEENKIDKCKHTIINKCK